MSEPFLAEIKIVGFNFAQRGWALCDGQILPINQNQSLYSLLGTTFGGDGRVNFALPDLRSRVAIHTGGGHSLGERAGEAGHTLVAVEMPQHTHTLALGNLAATALANSAPGNSRTPVGNSLAMEPLGVTATYSTAAPDASMAPSAIAFSGATANAGGNQAHDNVQPFLVISYCIALQGIFPSPT